MNENDVRMSSDSFDAVSSAESIRDDIEIHVMHGGQNGTENIIGDSNNLPDDMPSIADDTAKASDAKLHSHAFEYEDTKQALRKQNSDGRRMQIYSVLEDDMEPRATSPRPET